jgi:hypothetical protein
LNFPRRAAKRRDIKHPSPSTCRSKEFGGEKKSGRLDAVRTFSGRGPRLESLLETIDRQAGGWEMTERPKLSNPARATLGLQQWHDGRVHCSAW